MKKLIIVFAVLVGFQTVSQNLKPISIKGKVTVEGGDLTGISVFNKTSKIGTITDENGEFTLPVKLNDSIEVSALQFKNIGFLINQGIIKDKTMKIFLIHEINKLDEVVITGHSLSKSLKAQMKITGNFNPKLNSLYFGMLNREGAYNGIDYKTAVSNSTMNSQKQRMIHGLNIVNVVDQLLLPLFRSKVKDKEDIGIPEVPVESVKYYFGSDFLVDNFNIPEHRVEEFIRYVESDNFDVTLLNYGKEMEFLELIHKKSLQFLKKE